METISERLFNLLFHPLLISTFQQYLFIFIAGFTKPKSLLRPLGFLILVGTSWFALTNFESYLETPGWVPRALASAFPQMALTYFERMIVRKLSFSDEPPRDDLSAKAIFQSRLAFGKSVASNMRGLGTRWEIKDIHPFSTEDPTYVPELKTFICWNVLKTLFCYIGHCICLETQLSLDQSYMRPRYVPIFRRLHDVTFTELKVRYAATITTVVSLYCFIQGGYSLAAAVAVCLNPSSLKYWRPLFGGRSYNLRTFWANFWHQGLQNNIRGTATWITNNIFGIRGYTRTSRYLKILVAFFLSGVVHLPSDRASAVPYSQSGPVQFMCTQVIGLMIEDVMSKLFRKYYKSGERGHSRFTSLILHLMGYLWVISFLAWSGPVRWFPVISLQKRETEMIRLSALRPLAKAFA